MRQGINSTIIIHYSERYAILNRLNAISMPNSSGPRQAAGPARRRPHDESTRKARSMTWPRLFRSCLLVLVLLLVPSGVRACRANDLLQSQSDGSSSVPATLSASARSQTLPSGFPNATNTGPVAGTDFQILHRRL